MSASGLRSHSSRNLDPRETRYAALLQYASVGTAVRIPKRLAWPFEWHQTPRPPCIVVSGRDASTSNRLMPGPVASGASRPILTSRVHAVELPLDQDPEVGWKPHHLFRGATPDVGDMGCHVSVLDPGREPHPSHRHEEEELLVILDGEADLVWGDSGDGASVERHRVDQGTFAYYPSHFPHTIRNTSTEPVTYLMFKWVADSGEGRDALEQRLVRPFDSSADASSDPSSSFHPDPVLDGATSYLRHLHAHLTTLQPGAGYAPHVDAYDVGIVVLEGTVEVLGEKVGPHGVVFCAGGEPHGMLNPREVPAVYLVFEFHGRHSTRYGPGGERGAHRPRPLGRRVTEAGRSLAEAVPAKVRRLTQR